MGCSSPPFFLKCFNYGLLISSIFLKYFNYGQFIFSIFLEYFNYELLISPFFKKYFNYGLLISSIFFKKYFNYGLLISSSELTLRAFLWEASRATKGALPAYIACLQRREQRHQRSPGLRPGKPQGLGVERSLPMLFV